MYTEAPFEEITLDEFELVALDRLQVLRKIEDLKVLCCGVPGSLPDIVEVFLLLLLQDLEVLLYGYYGGP